MIFEKPQRYRQVGGSLNCFNKSFVTLFGQAGWPDALGRVSATTGWGWGGGGARVVVVGGGGAAVVGAGAGCLCSGSGCPVTSRNRSMAAT